MQISSNSADFFIPLFCDLGELLKSFFPIRVHKINFSYRISVLVKH
jgi:hypothetical protein